MVTRFTYPSFCPTKQLSLVKRRFLISSTSFIFADSIWPESLTLHSVFASIVILYSYYNGQKRMLMFRIIILVSNGILCENFWIYHLPVSHFLLSLEATFSSLQNHVPFRHSEPSIRILFAPVSHGFPSSTRIVCVKKCLFSSLFKQRRHFRKFCNDKIHSYKSLGTFPIFFDINTISGSSVLKNSIVNLCYSHEKWILRVEHFNKYI